jgi:hypothetical protein
LGVGSDKLLLDYLRYYFAQSLGFAFGLVRNDLANLNLRKFNYSQYEMNRVLVSLFNLEDPEEFLKIDVKDKKLKIGDFEGFMSTASVMDDSAPVEDFIMAGRYIRKGKLPLDEMLAAAMVSNQADARVLDWDSVIYGNKRPDDFLRDHRMAIYEFIQDFGSNPLMSIAASYQKAFTKGLESELYSLIDEQKKATGGKRPDFEALLDKVTVSFLERAFILRTGGYYDLFGFYVNPEYQRRFYYLGYQSFEKLVGFSVSQFHRNDVFPLKEEFVIDALHGAEHEVFKQVERDIDELGGWEAFEEYLFNSMYHERISGVGLLRRLSALFGNSLMELQFENATFIEGSVHSHKFHLTQMERLSEKLLNLWSDNKKVLSRQFFRSLIRNWLPYRRFEGTHFVLAEPFKKPYMEIMARQMLRTADGDFNNSDWRLLENNEVLGMINDSALAPELKVELYRVLQQEIQKIMAKIKQLPGGLSKNAELSTQYAELDSALAKRN